MSCRRWVVSWKTYLWNFAIIIGRHSRGIFQCEASRSVINAWIRHQVFVDYQLLLVFKDRRRSRIKVELYLKICLNWSSVASQRHPSVKFEQSEFLSDILNNLVPIALRGIEISLSFVQSTLISVRMFLTLCFQSLARMPFRSSLWIQEVPNHHLWDHRVFSWPWEQTIRKGESENYLLLKMCRLSRYLYHSLKLYFRKLK